MISAYELMEIVFWLSGLAVLYTYAGYPLLLMFWPRRKYEENSRADGQAYEPAVSIIIPVYNEEKVIRDKIVSTIDLDYQREKLEIIVVSDASDDLTPVIVREYRGDGVNFYELPGRQGKAGALNLGLQKARHDIIVFSDASIELERGALRKLVDRFADPSIGCVSGEDHIPGGGGEGAYGRYELALRNLENRAGSIVGASGCFYAQRRDLCRPFREGMAPDFFSVLETVEKGFRAVTEPEATGLMKSVAEPRGEFSRKVRTFLRGMTTLLHFNHLLNPFRYGIFSLQLFSHKILRWSAGLFLVLLFISNLFLAGSAFYGFTLAIQSAFYGLAVVGWLFSTKPLIFRIPFFFSMVNLSALVAWAKYAMGVRQEIWEPTRR